MIIAPNKPARFNLLKALLMFVSGGLYTLGFSPFNWWPLVILSLVLFFVLVTSSRSKQAALFGFCFGLGLFGSGISWMYISISTFGGLPNYIAVMCIFLLVAFMSLYFGLTGYGMSVTNKMPTWLHLWVVVPAIWVIIEWLRGWLFSGLPWLSAGYAFIDTPLSHYAPIGGVYLLSLWGCLSAAVITRILQSSSWRPGLIGLLLLSLIWGGGFYLQYISWTEEINEEVSVSIIQNNNAISLKWDPNRAERIVNAYLNSSEQLKDSSLIVWPEAAVPYFTDQIQENVWGFFDRHPSDFIFGALHRDKKNRQAPMYNVVVSHSDQTNLYRKQHLVPFGEYFPFRSLIQPLIDMMNIPVSNLSQGEKPQAPLSASGIQFAISICYEDAFPEVWREQVPDAQALLNVSEDIWFGDSLAPHQRLQMARFRARETERPMIRSSNNGLSAVIGYKGNIEAIAPQFQHAIVTSTFQPRTGTTPYVAWGNWIIISFLFCVIFMAILMTLFIKNRQKLYR